MISNEKRVLFGLSGGHFMLDMYAAILIPLYPVIAARLNINLVTISTVIAIGHAVSSVLQPVFGHISDKLNKRIFMFFGLIFASLFMPLCFIAPNAVVLTICLGLGMIGNAFYHPQVTTMIKDSFSDNLKFSYAIGLFLGLGTIGYAFGPYFSTCILDVFGDKNYVYIGLIGILASIFMLFFVPKLNKKEHKNDIDFLAAIKEILKSKVCIFLIIATVIKASLVMSFGTYIPFLLRQYNMDKSAGIIMTIFFIAGGISMIISSKIEKHLKLKGMIALSYLPLLPLTLLSLYFLKQFKIVSVLLIIAIGFFILLAASVVLAHAQKEIPEHSGAISGIIQGFTLAMGSIILIPLGYIGQKIGVGNILIIISFVAFIFALYTVKTKIIKNN